MTVPNQVPVVEYTASGGNLRFEFTWIMRDDDDIRVRVNNVDQVFGVNFYLDDYEVETGGAVVFYEDSAPVVGATVTLFRRTPVTQEVDYEEGEPFPAETHEEQLDKDTLILQEIIGAGLALGGPVDLGSIQRATEVEITNTSGENAIIRQWDCAGAFSGVFLGEITNDAPADASPTNRPDGYVWFEIDDDAAQPGNGILMANTDIIYSRDIAGYIYVGVRTSQNFLQLFNAFGVTEEIIREEPILTQPTNGLEQMWVRFDVISGTPYTIEPVNQWIDGHEEFRTFGIFNNSPGTSQTLTGTLRIAPDDGGGNPDETLEVSRFVSITINA